MMYFSHIPSGFNNLVAWNLTGGELFAALKILLGRIEAGSMSSVSLWNGNARGQGLKE